MKHRYTRHIAAAITVALVGVPAVVTSSQAPAAPTLDSHAVRLDSGGKLVSWVTDQNKAYDTVVGLAWNYLLHKVPDDPATDMPAYFSASYLDPSTDPSTVVGWPTDPGSMNSMLIESAMDYYRYSGNSAVLAFVERLADHQLKAGMTKASDNWSDVPYASGESGSLTYRGASYGDSSGVGDGTGYIEPDKVGEVGHALIGLYEQTDDTTYRNAAIKDANALASHVRPGNSAQSPWPFRVDAATGKDIREEYTAAVIRPIQLFDELIRLGVGDVSAYSAARKTAWTWLMKYPMKNDAWSAYYEDVPIQQDTSNHNTMTAMMTAKYLLQNPGSDPDWLAHVKHLIAWVNREFGKAQYGAETIKEQTAFAYPMGSHTNQYAEVNALLYARTGNATAKATAFRSLNWSTYMTRSNGVVIDGPEVGQGGNQWFTDGYGDSIRYYLGAMGAVPAWAPDGRNHVLASTSVVSKISYAPARITYRTFDAASTDTIKLADAPTTVTVDGAAALRRTDLMKQGWTYDASTHVLRLRHTSGHTVHVSTGRATTLSLSTSPGTLVYGKSAKLSGHLSTTADRAALPNARVTIHLRRHTPDNTAKWTSWRTVTTNARGDFATALSMPKTSTDLYASYVGTSDGTRPLAPSRSSVARVAVTYRAHATGPKAAVAVGRLAHVTVAIAPVASVSVVLERLSSNHWHTVSARHTTSSSGKYSFAIRPSKPGTAVMRVVVAASQSVAGTVSNIVRVVAR